MNLFEISEISIYNRKGRSRETVKRNNFQNPFEKARLHDQHIVFPSFIETNLEPCVLYDIRFH